MGTLSKRELRKLRKLVDSEEIKALERRALRRIGLGLAISGIAAVIAKLLTKD